MNISVKGEYALQAAPAYSGVRTRRVWLVAVPVFGLYEIQFPDDTKSKTIQARKSYWSGIFDST